MPAKLKQKSAYKHRRQRLSRWQLLSYAAYLFGNLLYYVGTIVERSAFYARRRLRRAGRALARGFGRLFAGLGRLLRATVGTACLDLLNPVLEPLRVALRCRKERKSLSAEEYDDYAAQARHRLRAGRHHRFSRFLNTAAPIVATVLLVTVFSYVARATFALQLQVQGEFVGYVSQESEYIDAKRMLQSRMVNVEGADWVDRTSYTIAIVDKEKLTGTAELANNILLASGTDITEGTGVFVGGVFLGCTSDSEKIHERIDAIIDQYKGYVTDAQDAVVRFRHQIELVDGIFPTSTVKDYDYFDSMIESDIRTDLVYTFAAGDSIDKIASLNSLTVDKLKELNPTADFDNLTAGTKLLVAQNERLFSVRTLVVQTYIESIAYSTTVIPNSNYEAGYYQIVDRGSSGENEVTVEIEYQNGVEISRTIVETKQITPVVDETIIIGTKPPAGTDAGAVGTGYLMVPVKDYLYIFRGWIPGVHRGIDYTAARGTPVYAADNGVVTFAGWHGAGNTGFGNYVAIDHNNSMKTHYAHLDGYTVKIGDIVTKGQLIGFVGATGNSTGFHLHFAITINNSWVPAEPYLRGDSHM